METTRPPKSIHWVTSTSFPTTAGLWAIPREFLKKRSYTHTFSSPGGANVRYAWGLGRKRRVKTSTILWISRKSLPGVANEASRIFLPGHGKRGEPKIFIRQVRRPLMFFFSTPLSASTAVWYHQRIWLPLSLSLLCGPVKTLIRIYSIIQAF